ncbi:MAG: tetratricopeptide repeat protein [Pirellulales bacterium]
MNDKALAAAALDKAVKLAPEEKDVIAARVDVELRENHLEEARRLAEKLIGIYPKIPTSYLYLAESYKQERKFDEALAALDRGLGAIPDNPALLSYKLELEFSKTPPDLAGIRASIDRLRKSGAMPQEALRLQEGRILTIEGKWSAALAELNAATARLTDNRQILLANRLKALCHGQLGNYDVAKNLYATILAATPNDLEVRLQSAMLLLRGRNREVLPEFEAIAKTLGPELTLKNAVVWRRCSNSASTRKWRCRPLRGIGPWSTICSIRSKRVPKPRSPLPRKPC